MDTTQPGTNSRKSSGAGGETQKVSEGEDVRRGRLWRFAPAFAFALIWIGGVSLAHIHIVRVQSDWSAQVYALMVSALLSFVAGAALGDTLASRIAPHLRRVAHEARRTRPVHIALMLCLAVGYAELIHQFVVGGSVPLFASNIDEARFSLPGGPTTVLRDGLTVAAIVAVALPRRLSIRESPFELAVAGLAIFGFLLEGGRTPVVLPLIAGFLARWIRFGLPRGTQLLLGGGGAVLAVSLLFFFRTAQHTSNAFENELYTSVVPETPFLLLPLLPLFFAIAMNFEALARLVEHFPKEQAFAGGDYSAHGYDLLIPGAQQVGEVSLQLNPPWTTSTFAGSLWGDWGFPGVIVGGLLIGALAITIYGLALRTRRFSLQLLGGYLSFLAVFATYTNLFTQQPDWLIVSPLLVVLGELATAGGDRPKGLQDYIAAISSRRKAIVAAGTVAVLAAVGAILSVTLPSSDDAQLPPVAPSFRSMLPSQSGNDTVLLTDGDGDVESEPVWVARRRGSSFTISSWDVTTRPARRLETHRLAIPGVDPDATLDISRLGGEGQTGLFVIEERASRVTVSGYSLKGRALVRGSVRLPDKAADAKRVFSIATYGGTRSDLIAVDQGSRLARAQVVVVAGESGYRRVGRAIRLPFRGLSAEQWRIDFGLFDGSSADLMAFRTRTEGLRHSEIHVAPGEVDFRSFSFERELDLPPSLPDTVELLSSRFRGAEAIYAIDRTDGSVRVFPLKAPARAI